MKQLITTNSMPLEIKTLADTIIWLARERRKHGLHTNLAAAIVAVCNDTDSLLCKFLSEVKDEQRN